MPVEIRPDRTTVRAGMHRLEQNSTKSVSGFPPGLLQNKEMARFSGSVKKPNRSGSLSTWSTLPNSVRLLSASRFVLDSEPRHRSPTFICR
jgi:hypothetical protein